VKKEKVLFDCEKFMSRIGMDRYGLADKLGVKYSTIGNYCSGASTPNYDTIVNLVNLGITAQELLGKEVGNELVKNSMVDTDSQTPEIASMLKDGVMKAVLELKSEGKL
jgi:transcriptional regulator with XRE-family HTH domain